MTGSERWYGSSLRSATLQASSEHPLWVKRIEAARKARIEAREALHAAIVAEALSGTSQVDIIRRSGYSRDRVRTILRAGGVEAD